MDLARKLERAITTRKLAALAGDMSAFVAARAREDALREAVGLARGRKKKKPGETGDFETKHPRAAKGRKGGGEFASKGAGGVGGEAGIGGIDITVHKHFVDQSKREGAAAVANAATGEVDTAMKREVLKQKKRMQERRAKFARGGGTMP